MQTAHRFHHQRRQTTSPKNIYRKSEMHSISIIPARITATAAPAASFFSKSKTPRGANRTAQSTLLRDALPILDSYNPLGMLRILGKPGVLLLRPPASNLSVRDILASILKNTGDSFNYAKKANCLCPSYYCADSLCQSHLRRRPEPVAKYGNLPKADWQQAADDAYIAATDKEYHGDRKKASTETAMGRLALFGWRRS